MKSLKSITLNTQIHQFCDNQSEKLLRLIIFSRKSRKKMSEFLKIPRTPPPAWLNVKANLQQTLN